MEKGGENKVKLVYSNYNECKKCQYSKHCYNTNHRTITRYVHEVTYKVERLMSSEEEIEKYKSRSKTVEAHNGTFKRIYHYNDIPLKCLERVQNLMFIISSPFIFSGCNTAIPSSTAFCFTGVSRIFLPLFFDLSG